MTSSSRHRAPQDRHGRTLTNEIEGYLLLHTERGQAQREAEALCARLHWLTRAQAEELTHHYTEQRLGLTRQALQATADRAEGLRREYETRYATLRRTLLRRHAACACLLIACSTTAGALVRLLAR
ncbi:hypothetical protein ABZ845_31285 [Streptomyces sp. NPDC047022]|uniref:hypothetical protein n=1 Tax=Streptomyces sp. NPDC047022 TaxID=3155737 RepID=UPI00340E16A9